MTSRRDTSTVIYDILTVIKDGASQNQILKKANVGFHLARKYVSYFLENGHVKLSIDRLGCRKFLLTDKGEHLCEALAEVQKDLMGLFPGRDRPYSIEPVVHQLIFDSSKKNGQALAWGQALSDRGI